MNLVYNSNINHWFYITDESLKRAPIMEDLYEILVLKYE